MQTVITAALLMMMSALALVYPPAVAAICMLVAPAETPSVGVVFTSFARVPTMAVWALCLLAACRAGYKLWVQRAGSTQRRKAYLSGMALFCTLWVGFAVYWSESSMGRAIVQMVSCGVYGVVFALAYHRNRTAMAVMTAPVAIHLALGIAILKFPGSALGLLRPISTLASVESEIAGITGEGIMKASAQFNNPVPLAFYAAVAVMIGLYLIIERSSRWSVLGGVVLLALGAYSSYVTVQRAIWLGAAFGGLVLLAPVFRRSGARSALAVGMTLCAIGLACTLLPTENTPLGSLLDYFRRTSDGNYRVMAAINSVDILFSKPFFGVGGDVTGVLDAAGGIPHQSFYFLAVMYGLPVGLCVLLMTWRVFRSVLPGGGGGPTPQERYLSVAIGWVVLSMALSNNMSAGLAGWICLGFACLPWVYRREKWSSVA